MNRVTATLGMDAELQGAQGDVARAGGYMVACALPAQRIGAHAARSVGATGAVPDKEALLEFRKTF